MSAWKRLLRIAWPFRRTSRTVENMLQKKTMLAKTQTVCRKELGFPGAFGSVQPPYPEMLRSLDSLHHGGRCAIEYSLVVSNEYSRMKNLIQGAKPLRGLGDAAPGERSLHGAGGLGAQPPYAVALGGNDPEVA